MHAVSYITEHEGQGVVRAISTHHAYALVLSPRSGDIIEKSIAGLHERLKDDPPHTPADALALLARYAGDLHVALMTHKDHVLTLVTQGSGVIYLRRGGSLVELVAEGSGAQGPPERGDEYILTTTEFLELVGGLEGMRYYFTHYTGAEVVELMKTYEDQSIPCGFVVVQYGLPPGHEKSDVIQPSDTTSSVQSVDTHTREPEVEEHTGDVEVISSTETVPPRVSLREKLSHIGSTITRRIPLGTMGVRLRTVLTPSRVRLIALIALPTIFLIYLALRNLDSIRSTPRPDSDVVTRVGREVDAILASAETEAFVKRSGVSATIQSAREVLDELSANDRQKYQDSLSVIRKRIDDTERSLMKVIDAPVEEYYDLKLIPDAVEVTDVDFNGKSFVILDATRGAVYVVDTPKRAHEIYTSDKYKGARQVTATDRYIYVLTATDGIYLATSEGSKRVVKADSRWGKISDMKAYTGNIYLLDAGRRNIVKYSGIDEETFGDETPYLVPELQGVITTTDRMTIDGAVYTIGGGDIDKFVSGRRADFDFEEPYKDVEVTALYTDPDIEYLYTYDRMHQAVYAHEKSGIFSRQWRVDMPVLQTAVSQETGKVYLITENMIYQMTDAPHTPEP